MNVTIEKLEIVAFGKLQSVILDVKSGINILSAPNESGKSTLAAFVKFMFYGFAGARMQTLTENEKKLYTPWDGEMCAGALNLTADGGAYRIERTSYASGKETVDIIDRTTGKVAFIGEVPGSVFFGVGEEVFSRTLFFRQLTLPQSRDELLADKLRDIAISADEQVSTKKALTKLTAARNELKGRAGSGLIPKTERERDALEEELTKALEAGNGIASLLADASEKQKQIAECEDRLEALQNERRNIEKYEALIRFREIKRLRDGESEARLDYDKASEGLKQSGGDDGSAVGRLYTVNSDYIAEQARCKSIAESLDNAERARDECEASMPIDCKQAREAESELASAKRIFIALSILFGVLVLAGALVYIINQSLVAFVLLGVALIVAAAGAIYGTRPVALAKKYGVESHTKLKEILSKYPDYEKELYDRNKEISSLTASYEESRRHYENLKNELSRGISEYRDINDDVDYGVQLTEILERSRVIGEKLAVWRARSEAFEKAIEGVDLTALGEEARGAVQPERTRAEVDRDIKFYSQKNKIIGEALGKNQMERVALESKFGNPALLVGKRDSLNKQIVELDKNFKAFDAAIQMLNEASDFMKSMVAPRIGERADGYFVTATDGKYNNLGIDTKMAMSFGGDFRRSCDYLSAGTRDSAYLCLRLALADMLFGGCGVPILLDDAFVRIDEERLKSMARALSSASTRHQIIILTHGIREEKALSECGIPFTKTDMRKVDKR